MSTSTSFFKSIAAQAKAHHESVNAAYSVYYSQGQSPRPSMEARQPSTASTSSASSSVGKTWRSIKKHAKENHESMNAAYATYYGGVAASPVSSPRESVEFTPSQGEEKAVQVSVEGVDGRENSIKKAAAELERRAKAHHRGINAAYQSYYGAGVATL